jgi:hypothetical protein
MTTHLIDNNVMLLIVGFVAIVLSTLMFVFYAWMKHARLPPPAARLELPQAEEESADALAADPLRGAAEGGAGLPQAPQDAIRDLLTKRRHRLRR